MTGGGFLPGPFVTIFFSLFLVINEPIVVFLALQCCFVISLIIGFYFAKKYFGEALGWLFILVVTSPSMYMYVYSAWHAAFAPTVYLLALLAIDRGAKSLKPFWFILTGFLFGITIQFHFSSFAILLTLPLFILSPRSHVFKNRIFYHFRLFTIAQLLHLL